jgi:hypothetical protein
MNKIEDLAMKTFFSMTLAAGLAFGQQAGPTFPERDPAGARGQRTFTYFSRGSAEVVKGAPYTADSISEHVQVLQDGNRISHTNKSSFARDSEGRTRRETEIIGLGSVGQTEEPIKSVFIEDPVAKVQYTLDSQRKVAMKHNSEGGMQFKIATGIGGTARAGAPTAGFAVAGVPAIAAARTIQRDDIMIERKIEGETKELHRVESVAMLASPRSEGDVKTEDLGTRNMEGVSVKGTKMVMTIAAGEVGNERPIQVVTETWYSDEIKAVVLTKHSDPRNGETTNRLSNLRLGEPSKTLFEPPSDYKVEEMSNMRMPMSAPGFRVKEDR